MVLSGEISIIADLEGNSGGIKLHNQKTKLRTRFDILKKLGQGTYGKVQLAVNKDTGEEVAIKTIKKSKIESDSDLLRIQHEIQIMSSVQHPHIIHIYEVFENKEKIVLVMEYADGGELYDYLSQRKFLCETEARRIFRQVASAVFYCHKNKICHRDLKLENILLDQKGNAKIADFGLSNIFDEKHLLNTFCGSPLYASPEIVKGVPYFGPEVDCWSLGVLLYTLVYGAMPFDGSDFKKLVKQITSGQYFEPKSLGTNASAHPCQKEASKLIRRMLTVDPTKRATIEDICGDWWVNAGHKINLVEQAEEACKTLPIRLDMLLLVPPISAAPAPAAAENDGRPDMPEGAVAAAELSEAAALLKDVEMVPADIPPSNDVSSAMDTDSLLPDSSRASMDSTATLSSSFYNMTASNEHLLMGTIEEESDLQTKDAIAEGDTAEKHKHHVLSNASVDSTAQQNLKKKPKLEGKEPSTKDFWKTANSEQLKVGDVPPVALTDAVVNTAVSDAKEEIIEPAAENNTEQSEGTSSPESSKADPKVPEVKKTSIKRKGSVKNKTDSATAATKPAVNGTKTPVASSFSRVGDARKAFETKVNTSSTERRGSLAGPTPVNNNKQVPVVRKLSLTSGEKITPAPPVTKIEPVKNSKKSVLQRREGSEDRRSKSPEKPVRKSSISRRSKSPERPVRRTSVGPVNRQTSPEKPVRTPVDSRGASPDKVRRGSKELVRKNSGRELVRKDSLRGSGDKVGLPKVPSPRASQSVVPKTDSNSKLKVDIKKTPSVAPASPVKECGSPGLRDVSLKPNLPTAVGSRKKVYERKNSGTSSSDSENAERKSIKLGRSAVAKSKLAAGKPQEEPVVNSIATTPPPPVEDKPKPKPERQISKKELSVSDDQNEVTDTNSKEVLSPVITKAAVGQFALLGVKTEVAFNMGGPEEPEPVVLAPAPVFPPPAPVMTEPAFEFGDPGMIYQPDHSVDVQPLLKTRSREPVTADELEIGKVFDFPTCRGPVEVQKPLCRENLIPNEEVRKTSYPSDDQLSSPEMALPTRVKAEYIVPIVLEDDQIEHKPPLSRDRSVDRSRGSRKSRDPSASRRFGKFDYTLHNDSDCNDSDSEMPRAYNVYRSKYWSNRGNASREPSVDRSDSFSSNDELEDIYESLTSERLFNSLLSRTRHLLDRISLDNHDRWSSISRLPSMKSHQSAMHRLLGTPGGAAPSSWGLSSSRPLSPLSSLPYRSCSHLFTDAVPSGTSSSRIGSNRTPGTYSSYSDLTGNSGPSIDVNIDSSSPYSASARMSSRSSYPRTTFGTDSPTLGNSIYDSPSSRWSSTAAGGSSSRLDSGPAADMSSIYRNTATSPLTRRSASNSGLSYTRSLSRDTLHSDINETASTHDSKQTYNTQPQDHDHSEHNRTYPSRTRQYNGSHSHSVLNESPATSTRLSTSNSISRASTSFSRTTEDRLRRRGISFNENDGVSEPYRRPSSATGYNRSLSQSLSFSDHTTRGGGGRYGQGGEPYMSGTDLPSGRAFGKAPWEKKLGQLSFDLESERSPEPLVDDAGTNGEQNGGSVYNNLNEPYSQNHTRSHDPKSQKSMNINCGQGDGGQECNGLAGKGRPPTGRKFARSDSLKERERPKSVLSTSSVEANDEPKTNGTAKHVSQFTMQIDKRNGMGEKGHQNGVHLNGGQDNENHENHEGELDGDEAEMARYISREADRLRKKLQSLQTSSQNSIKEVVGSKVPNGEAVLTQNGRGDERFGRKNELSFDENEEPRAEEEESVSERIRRKSYFARFNESPSVSRRSRKNSGSSNGDAFLEDFVSARRMSGSLKDLCNFDFDPSSPISKISAKLSRQTSLDRNFASKNEDLLGHFRSSFKRYPENGHDFDGNLMSSYDTDGEASNGGINRAKSQRKNSVDLDGSESDYGYSRSASRARGRSGNRHSIAVFNDNGFTSDLLQRAIEMTNSLKFQSLCE